MIVLKLDWDGARYGARYRQMEMVCRILRLRRVYVRLDRTAHGWHCIVGLAQAKMSLMRVLVLQALMGDDVKRGAFNVRRMRGWRRRSLFWRARVNVLYVRHERGVRL